ncbi:DoxX family protein [Rhodococcus sp. 077-4]|uniref:DoxX family protein n=1 Tax=Rhodococcus sp. 077-4 TaxID=2789271 RepID=UPI0039F5153B
MIDTPHVWWLTAALAVILLADALLPVRPPVFIRNCLDSVAFPREWWWTLVVIKLLAAAGLIAGLQYPGVGISATAGVVAYFACAAPEHVRAHFVKQESWLNCFGMLALSSAVLVVSYTDLIAG